VLRLRVTNVALETQNLRSLFIAVSLHADVKSIKPMSFAMETQEWVPFPVVTSYKIFRAAGDSTSINVLGSSREIRDNFLSDFIQI
jgi:hypothetical protein